MMKLAGKIKKNEFSLLCWLNKLLKKEHFMANQKSGGGGKSFVVKFSGTGKKVFSFQVNDDGGEKVFLPLLCFQTTLCALYHSCIKF